MAGFRHEWTRGWPTQQAADIDRLAECARFNLTLIQTYVYLDAFVDQPLNATFLSSISSVCVPQQYEISAT